MNTLFGSLLFISNVCESYNPDIKKTSNHTMKSKEKGVKRTTKSGIVGILKFLKSSVTHNEAINTTISPINNVKNCLLRVIAIL